MTRALYIIPFQYGPFTWQDADGRDRTWATGWVSTVDLDGTEPTAVMMVDDGDADATLLADIEAHPDYIRVPEPEPEVPE